MSARGLAVAVLLGMVIAAPVGACLWDTDTLQMERKRFPGADELITGRFVRHSRAYYEWRLEDRLKRVQPYDPEVVDDLAVAYDKLGRQSEGIAILESCLSEHPDRYETIANLGTLLIHSGKPDEGAKLIERAIEINPQAHFGREKYQLLLVRYIQQSELKSKGVLSSESRWQQHEAAGFAKFVLEQKDLPTHGYTDISTVWKAQSAELDAARKGILGILHFGNFESPVVLEALGDVLLRCGEGPDDARLLAARAYLKASFHVTGPEAVTAYETMADEALAPN